MQKCNPQSFPLLDCNFLGQVRSSTQDLFFSALHLYLQARGCPPPPNTCGQHAGSKNPPLLIHQRLCFIAPILLISGEAALFGAKLEQTWQTNKYLCDVSSHAILLKEQYFGLQKGVYGDFYQFPPLATDPMMSLRVCWPWKKCQGAQGAAAGEGGGKSHRVKPIDAWIHSTVHQRFCFVFASFQQQILALAVIGRYPVTVKILEGKKREFLIMAMHEWWKLSKWRTVKRWRSKFYNIAAISLEGYPAGSW